LLAKDGINTSVITTNRYQSDYIELYEGTGGVFACINGNFKTELIGIADNIETKTNDGYWIALKGLIPKIVKLDEEPSFTGTADTDGDELLDKNELKSTKPTEYIDINSMYATLMKSKLDAVGYEYPSIGVYDYYSDPTEKDTDKDDILDSKDIQPKIANIFTEDFVNYINNDIINMRTVETTTDNFIISKTPISEMIKNACADKLYDSVGDVNYVDRYYDDWYLFAVNGSVPTYGLYKMREQEYDHYDFDGDGEIDADGDNPGVTISFIEFDLSKLNDVIDGKETSIKILDKEINRIVLKTEVEISEDLRKYFENVETEGAYLIAEAYVKKIAGLSDSDKMDFPEILKDIYDEIDEINYAIELESRLETDSTIMEDLINRRESISRIPNALKDINKKSGETIVDKSERQIIVSNKNSLSLYEKQAILSSFTGDISFNMFAAEVQAHAVFASDWKMFIDKWHDAAIRADMGVGEEYESGLYDAYYNVESDWVQNQIKSHGEY